jgi:hypothetical protein
MASSGWWALSRAHRIGLTPEQVETCHALRNVMGIIGLAPRFFPVGVPIAGSAILVVNCELAPQPAGRSCVGHGQPERTNGR